MGGVNWPNRFVVRTVKQAQADGRPPAHIQGVLGTAIGIAMRHLHAEPRLVRVANDR